MPIDGTQLTHPGVYCLRTNELRWDAATLWQTYTLLTDLEAVFRSLKSELGLRPVYHHKEDRADGHLFITVLAYQAVQVLRRKLKLQGINASWTFAAGDLFRTTTGDRHLHPERRADPACPQDNRGRTQTAEPLRCSIPVGHARGHQEIGELMDRIHECSATAKFSIRNRLI